MVAIGGEEPMQEPGGHGERIYVSVRLRPLNERETARNDVSDWECINDTTIIYRNNLSVSERSMYPTAYTFDRVFGTDCSTRRVYEEGAKKVALSVVSGINTSIFAYGQTSSGKTYTMNGITKYTVADIYDYIETHKEREFVLKFSAIEIYNEAVRDLLSADTTPLRLLDDPERGTTVERLTEETLTDWNHFLELLSVCEAQRQIGETSLNEASSRSHQILRLVIESSAREFLGYDKSSSLTAIVNFVDLAGSERASQTLSAGTRLKEGCHINRSLLTLGTVIRKLSKGRNGHVPYRDSKLTRILQSSLGGNARTAIICTMSPAHIHVEQSRNTLLFASCAKEVTTNAQVNVVMSDKALVKHLQRELTRLESELRCTGPKTVSADSSTLLREKDRQIEKLKKEVADLVLQRDVAQSQVKDLVQVLGEDKPSMVDLERYYPKLRVRNSWDFENQTSGAPVLGFPHRRANSVRSFDTSQYSDGDSRTSSEDTILQLPDFEENFLHTDSSQKLSVSRPNFVDTNLHQEESKEQSDERSEDLCKEVQCIEMEESSTNRYIVPNTLESSTNRYIVTNTSESSTNGCIVSNASESSTNGRIVSNASESSANTYQNSNMSSPIANTASSGLTMVENGDDTNQEPGSPLLNHEPGSPLLNQTGFVIPSPKKTSQWLPEKDGLMWLPEKVGLIWLPEKDRFCPSVLKLRRSKSCKASLMASLSSCWFEMVEKNESTPPIEFEKYFTGRPESFRKKLPSLKYGSEIERLSRNGSQASARSAAFEESKAQDTESTTDDKGTESSTLVEGTKEMTDTQCNTEPADSMVPETDSRLIPSARDVKDVGLDPIPIDVESPSRWPSEFQRLQREIIELWHACNVSLVHRTYFFLLFKGDPSDSIYMEVELRRLSFLKDTFSQGNQTLEDGQTLTPESSMRALARERHMLSKQMRSRLSINERNNLYLKWGIGLNSKNRRWQLANRLWSDTKSIDHITESATVVAKLVGSVQPEQAFKEMFGLRFTPRDTTRKSHRWTESFKSLV